MSVCRKFLSLLLCHIVCVLEPWCCHATEPHRATKNELQDLDAVVVGDCAGARGRPGMRELCTTAVVCWPGQCSCHACVLCGCMTRAPMDAWPIQPRQASQMVVVTKLAGLHDVWGGLAKPKSFTVHLPGWLGPSFAHPRR